MALAEIINRNDDDIVRALEFVKSKFQINRPN